MAGRFGEEMDEEIADGIDTYRLCRRRPYILQSWSEGSRSTSLSLSPSGVVSLAVQLLGLDII